MEKYITDERTGLKYELVGDYYIIAGDDEPEEEQKPIGIWGQRHLHYLKNYRKVLYTNLLTSGRLNIYLADIDRQAEEMFERLTGQMAIAEGVTEQLKADNQMAWVGKMNGIRNRAAELINTKINTHKIQVATEVKSVATCGFIQLFSLSSVVDGSV